MKVSNCIRCGNEEFWIVESRVEYNNNHVLFVQCKDCGGVVGVIDNSVANSLSDIAKKLHIE